MPLSLIGQRDYLMYCVNDFYGLVSVLGRNFVDIISLSAVSKLLAASPCLQSLRMHADISIFCLTKSIWSAMSTWLEIKVILYIKMQTFQSLLINNYIWHRLLYTFLNWELFRLSIFTLFTQTQLNNLYRECNLCVIISVQNLISIL